MFPIPQVQKKLRETWGAFSKSAFKKAIDELFDEWDKDGGGEIGYQELVKILKAKPASQPNKKK